MEDRELREGSRSESKRRMSQDWGESALERELGRQLTECIQQGSFPLEVFFALDYFADGDRLRCRARLLPSDPPACPAPVLVVDAVYRFRYEQFQQAVIEDIERSVRQQRSPLLSLVSLARIDAEYFVELGGEYFAGRLESPENELSNEPLPLFILYVHDVDPELIGGLVARTEANSPRAASRLRTLLLEAVDDPRCGDELGLLAAQALCDRLEQA